MAPNNPQEQVNKVLKDLNMAIMERVGKEREKEKDKDLPIFPDKINPDDATLPHRRTTNTDDWAMKTLRSSSNKSSNPSARDGIASSAKLTNTPRIGSKSTTKPKKSLPRTWCRRLLLSVSVIIWLFGTILTSRSAEDEFTRTPTLWNDPSSLFWIGLGTKCYYPR